MDMRPPNDTELDTTCLTFSSPAMICGTLPVLTTNSQLMVLSNLIRLQILVIRMLVSIILENTLEILMRTLISLSISAVPNVRSMKSMKICWISWNFVLINAPFPKLLLTPRLKPFLPTSVGYLWSTSRKRSRPLHSLRGMHLAILSAKHYHTRCPATNVDYWNEDIASDIVFSNTPAPHDMTMAFLVILDAPWHKSMVESKAPRPLHTG